MRPIIQNFIFATALYMAGVCCGSDGGAESGGQGQTASSVPSAGAVRLDVRVYEHRKLPGGVRERLPLTGVRIQYTLNREAPSFSGETERHCLDSWSEMAAEPGTPHHQLPIRVADSVDTAEVLSAHVEQETADPSALVWLPGHTYLEVHPGCPYAYTVLTGQGDYRFSIHVPEGAVGTLQHDAIIPELEQKPESFVVTVAGTEFSNRRACRRIGEPGFPEPTDTCEVEGVVNLQADTIMRHQGYLNPELQVPWATLGNGVQGFPLGLAETIADVEPLLVIWDEPVAQELRHTRAGPNFVVEGRFWDADDISNGRSLSGIDSAPGDDYLGRCALSLPDAATLFSGRPQLVRVSCDDPNVTAMYLRIDPAECENNTTCRPSSPN